MTEVRLLRFSDVGWLMEKINTLLLQNQKGLLLQAKVNDRNEVIDAEIVPVEAALRNGFEPAKFVGKGNK